MKNSTRKQTTLNALASSFTPPVSTLAFGTKKAAAAHTVPQKGVKRKKTNKSPRPLQIPSHENATLRSPRQPPSRSSGGVPSPSTRYLAQSLSPPTTLPKPRRILVILDLNGTLLYRPSRNHPSKFIERPHARAFLRYCLETFHLAIWSSARPQNVTNMVAQLLTPEQSEKCVLIWARDRFGLSQQDYDARVQVYKRLSLVWDNPQVKAAHPDARRGGLWDQSNTVLVDDSREKGRSEPYNILPIPEFAGLLGEPPNVLPQVHDYLNLLCSQADISRYIRENPFHLSPEYTLPVDF
ncbi:hypothetical protein ED733_007659 [Metarhizium rileyi]|nr:hypothetical protein ED733_007659 [Metarhizium rileyi]